MGRGRNGRSAGRGDRALGGLLAEILLAPDRDRCPGARPVVSVGEVDERAYLDAIARVARSRAALSRRGVWHGEWAELDPALVGADAAPPGGDEPAIARRWHSADPIVLPGALSARLPAFAREIAERAALHRELGEPGALRRWLERRAGELEPPFSILPARRGALADPARDVERVFLASEPPAGRGRRVDDLWLKSAWLSTHDDDESLRLRVSFGRERDDDASADLLRHRLVAELGVRLLPEIALASADPELVTRIERLTAERALLTQPIAYWNGPEGGARFHHDAFAEDVDAFGAAGQLGVCFVQMSGRTAWLALSIGALAARVVEFAGLLEEGELPWVRAQLFPDVARQRAFLRLVEDDARLLAELARPGCGSLGALVDRGPEFTAFLADAGHAWLLEPGDVVLLPNHGLERTAMHSVFSVGDETGYALSLAIRADRELLVVPDDDLAPGPADRATGREPR